MLEPYHVRVAAPTTASREDIEAIVRKRAAWIVEQPVAPAGGAPPWPPLFRGDDVDILVEATVGRGGVSGPDHGVLTVRVRTGVPAEERDDEAGRLLQGWFSERAHELVRAAVARWQGRVAGTPGRVLIRNQKTRWASCAADGTLRFNWRVAMLPPALLEYIVVHELVHLEVRNHSPAFWARVGALLPGYAERRRELRTMERLLGRHSPR